MGKPKIRAATPSANGARLAPNRLIRVSANTCAPPVISSSRPTITPRATSSATDPKVELKLDISASGTSASGMPAATAVTALTSTSETNACSLTFIMRNSSTATAAAAIKSSAVVPYAGSIGSMGTSFIAGDFDPIGHIPGPAGFHRVDLEALTARVRCPV